MATTPTEQPDDDDGDDGDDGAREEDDEEDEEEPAQPPREDDTQTAEQDEESSARSQGDAESLASSIAPSIAPSLASMQPEGGDRLEKAPTPPPPSREQRTRQRDSPGETVPTSLTRAASTDTPVRPLHSPTASPAKKPRGSETDAAVAKPLSYAQALLNKKR